MPEASTALEASDVEQLDCRRLGLAHHLVDYTEAWELQRTIHAAVADGSAPPTLLLLEHSEVFTAGRRTEDTDRPTDGSVVIDVDRGGRITWHGPGQVVAYPIVPLGTPVDVIKFVRALEDALMATCHSYGVETTRVAGRSGVWVQGTGGQAGAPTEPDRKVAAVGIRVARGVAMHGVALNVDCDLNEFTRIVPCGIPDAGVTSLAAEGAALPTEGAVSAVGIALGRQLHSALSLDD